MPDIFVSHSKFDNRIADKLSKYFERAGLDYFLDFKSLRPGDKWNSRIDNSLRDSNAVWILVSENALKSDNVKHEISVAVAMRKNVIPILLDVEPEEMDFRLSEYQAIIKNRYTPKTFRNLIRIEIKRQLVRKYFRDAGLGFLGAFISSVLITLTVPTNSSKD